MQLSSTLFVVLAALAGVEAIPVPLLGNLNNVLPYHPPTSTATSKAASTSVSSGQTPLGLINVLSGFGITVPKGLSTTTDGIDINGLNDIKTEQALRNLLGEPGVSFPVGENLEDAITRILRNDKSPPSRRGVYDYLNPVLRVSSSAEPKSTNIVYGVVNLPEVLPVASAGSPDINANPSALHVAVAPFVDLSPSLTLKVAPTDASRGPVGALGMELSAGVSIFGAEATETPKINV